jgi:predicted aspartyl protease
MMRAPFLKSLSACVGLLVTSTVARADLLPVAGKQSAPSLNAPNLRAHSGAPMLILAQGGCPKHPNQAQPQSPQSGCPIVPNPPGREQDSAADSSIEQPLNFTMDQDGVWIPVTINGQTKPFKIDTGGSANTLDSASADQLNLEHPRLHHSVTLFPDISTREFANVDALQLGSLSVRDVQFAVFGPGAIGNVTKRTLGADMLSKYNLEFDFAAKKLNILVPHGCAARTGRWPGSASAVLSMQPADAGEVRVAVTLDDKSLAAVVDTGSPMTVMSWNTFSGKFGVSATDPALKPDTVIVNNRPLPGYRYPFIALNIANAPMPHPPIFVMAPNNLGSHTPELLLGIDVLRNFRLCFAYDDQTLYALRPNGS